MNSYAKLSARNLSADLVRRVRALAAHAAAADGYPPLSDQTLTLLDRGAAEVLVAERDEHLIGVAVVTGAEFEVVVTPEARRRSVATELVDAVLTHESWKRAPSISAWAHGAPVAALRLAERFGFEPIRELQHLESRTRPSRREEAIARPASASAIRSFIKGADDSAWLALNSLAFSSHPEQGSLTQQDLDSRAEQPWFDAAGFLVVDGVDRDELIGYCWTKRSVDDPALGEIYALGVHPDHRGQGLGSALLDAGLASLTAAGCTRFELYAEADNAVALRVYESRGFHMTSRDIYYRVQR